MAIDPLVLLLSISLCCHFSSAWVSENRRIEEEILRNYDRRHRPVRQESTAVKVRLFLTINHIERVDENEGTMLLHGILWVSWNDEYLRWTPSAHNSTYVISMEAWKIWQPTFALYNSARSNSWFVYMNGVPATVSSDGRVFAAGTFSFQVTCQFDFSDFPYDVQRCPIVLADWVYDLSKVNLSEVVNSQPTPALSKPAIRLSFDPLSENVKKHVAGWEIVDTWQRHCYWGPNGYCIDENPIGPLDNYWSLIEFGVQIKRHAPYYGLTLVAPTFITALLTLLTFWLDNLPLAVFLCAINLLLEAFSGWSLTQQLPPGDGVMPTIGTVHMWNVGLTLLAMFVHCVIHFLLSVVPPHVKFLPEQLTNLTSLLGQYKFFRAEGLSFDPQTIMGFEPLLENHVGGAGDDLFEEDQSSPLLGRDSQPQHIIEMESLESSTTVEQRQRPFSPIELDIGELSVEQSTSQTASLASSFPKKSSSFFNSVFGAKEEPKGPTISTPFSGLFEEDKLTRQDSGAQLFVVGTGGDENKPEKELDGGDRREEGTDAEIESAIAQKKSLDADNAAPKGEVSPLEREFNVLRRLLFSVFLAATTILLSILIF